MIIMLSRICILNLGVVRRERKLRQAFATLSHTVNDVQIYPPRMRLP